MNPRLEKIEEEHIVDAIAELLEEAYKYDESPHNYKERARRKREQESWLYGQGTERE